MNGRSGDGVDIDDNDDDNDGDRQLSFVCLFFIIWCCLS